jgi:hypothetical protein
VHLELFAERRVVLIPPGIGVAGRCALRTTSSTGVVESVAGLRPTLGDFFDVWGQPLSRARLGAFHGTVHAYVGGRPWHRAVRRIALSPGAQISVEIGGFVQPHAFFLFPTPGP